MATKDEVFDVFTDSRQVFEFVSDIVQAGKAMGWDTNRSEWIKGKAERVTKFLAQAGLDAMPSRATVDSRLDGPVAVATAEPNGSAGD